jgi:hypothetical protein
VISSPNTNSSEDEPEHFLLGIGEDCKNICKSDLMEDRVKPIPVRNPDARVKNNFTTPLTSGVKCVSII